MANRKNLSGIDNAGQKGINFADGSVATDVATYGQMLNLLNGLDFKASVRVASTANVTVATPGSSIDTVALANGDGVLLKNQTTASENGLWTWNGAASAMTRRADGVQGELTSGATVNVTEGATNDNTQWTLITNDPITVGTTALSFTQTGAPGATYSAGNGLQLSSTTFSVKLPASSGLVADGTGLYLDSAIAVRKFASTIGDGSTTGIVVTHNLGTRDVEVTVYDAASFVEVDVDVVHTTANTITINFGTAPASNAYRVVVQG